MLGFAPVLSRRGHTDAGFLCLTAMKKHCSLTIPLLCFRSGAQLTQHPRHQPIFTKGQLLHLLAPLGAIPDALERDSLVLTTGTASEHLHSVWIEYRPTHLDNSVSHSTNLF